MHMRRAFLALLLIPYALAQDPTESGDDSEEADDNSESVRLSTSTTVFETLGPGRVTTTVTTDVVFTITDAPAAEASGDSNSDDDDSSSRNSTSSTSTTTPSNLPTAPSADAGGVAGGGAPFPGATAASCGAACGPDDDYINSAQKHVLSLSLAVVVVAATALVIA